MPDSTTGAVFADAFAAEDDAILGARDASAQFGIEAVSPAVGAALAVAAAGRPAATIVEIGTGVGVSGLWLLRGAPRAQLTTIDVDLDHHQVARGGSPRRATRSRCGSSRATPVRCCRG